MRVLFLAFLISFGSWHLALAAEESDNFASEGMDYSDGPVLANEDYVLPYAAYAAEDERRSGDRRGPVTRPNPPRPPGPVTQPNPPRPPGPVTRPNPPRPPGPVTRPNPPRPPRPEHYDPYHSRYDYGRWYYPDGRRYPIFPRGWGWDRYWYPFWWYPTILLSPWIWINDIHYDLWQCTAFDQTLEPFAAVGRTENEAAYNAIYACGGQFAGCYIPPNYCRHRR